MLEFVIAKVKYIKNICSGYMIFYILEDTQLIYHLDNKLELLEIKREQYIMVMNLIRLHLEVLIGYTRCFIIKVKK